MEKVFLYDTTLRDGAQHEGISFSLEDKLKITQKLDRLGIHYIEGGWPGSNPKDAEYFERVRDLELAQAKVAAFGSTRRADKGWRTIRRCRRFWTPVPRWSPWWASRGRSTFTMSSEPRWRRTCG